MIKKNPTEKTEQLIFTNHDWKGKRSQENELTAPVLLQMFIYNAYL